MPIRFTCPACGAVAPRPGRNVRGQSIACPRLLGKEFRFRALGKLVQPVPIARAAGPAGPMSCRLPRSTPPSRSARLAPPKGDFITLGCPSCGGNLQITKDADRFACKYCGREHLVRREHGVITVTPVLEKLDRIVSGVGPSGV